MSVTGFDFRALNQRFLTADQQPVNLAGQYGASVVKAPAGPAWRCIGIYHLAPDENNRRHNVFIDVLDEQGKRVRYPTVRWTWYMDAPRQMRVLDKPDNEPAADIPIEKAYTVTLWVEGDELPSDSVGNLHTRHPDEGVQNTYGHHSFYVVFQRQGAIAGRPDGTDGMDKPVDPLPVAINIAALRAQIGRVRAEVDALEGLLS